MQLVAVLCFISFSGLVAGDVVKVLQCADGPLPTSVDVAGCRSTPCELPKGQDVGVIVDFTADRPLSALIPKVQATVGGLTVPFVLPQDRQDACKWLIGGVCPVSREEDVTYELRLPVLASYPSISLTVELKLLDQDSATVTCFQVPATVV